MRPLRSVASRAAVLGSLCVSALGTTASHSATCSIFSATVSYPAGSAPNGIAVGDFDRDGIQDVAVTNNSGAVTFSVLRGKGSAGVGDGTFQPAVGFGASGLTPRAIVTTDLDEDGKLDLLVGVNNSLQIWIGAGNCSFTLKSTVSAGTTPRSIAVGDLDSDGVLDVAVANSAGNEVRLLRGDGIGGIASGALTPWSTIAVGTAPTRVLLADVSGDAILDIVTANNAGGSVSVVRGRGTAPSGDGTFHAPTTLNPGGSPSGIATGDFDEDGRVDLVVANSGGTVVTVYRGTGGGAFTRRGDFTVPLAPQDLVVGDFDGDGIADIAGACGGTHQAFVLTGTGAASVGDGGFAAARLFAVGTGPVLVAAGDLKADGVPDLITLNYSANSVSRLLGLCPSTLPTTVTVTSPNGGEPWWPGTSQTVSWTKGGGVISVDVDVSRDGGARWEPLARRLTGTSLVVPALTPTSSDVRVRVRDAWVPGRNDQSDAPANVCGLLAGPLVSNTGLAGLERAVVGDMDADGIADLAVAGPMSISLLRGDGGGGFTPWASAPADSVRALRCADVDGDNTLDVVTLEASAIRTRRAAAGAFMPALATTLPARGNDLVLADLDEDGILDAAVVGLDAAGGALWVMHGNGDGTFAPATRLALAGAGVHLVAADFDADGITDLAVSAGTALQLWRGQGANGSANGAFVLASERTLPMAPGELACGDFDGDHALDLVACLPLTGDVWRFRGVPAERRFEAPTAFAAGAEPRVMAVTDLDGDGGADLAVALGSGTGLVVLTGNGSTSPLPGSFDAPQSFIAQAGEGGGSVALVLGEFTGDGFPDVVTLDATGEVTCHPSQCPPMGTTDTQWTQSPALESRVLPGDEVALGWSRGIAVPLVSIDLSLDDGDHWQTLAQQVAAESWQWSVRGVYTSTARLRVRDAVVPARAAVSARFTIGAGPLDVPISTHVARLGAAWPSPARGAVSLALRLPNPSSLRATVCDLSGRQVRMLAEGAFAGGEHLLRWDGTSDTGAPAPAGVYFVVVRGNDLNATRRVVRLH